MLWGLVCCVHACTPLSSTLSATRMIIHKICCMPQKTDRYVAATKYMSKYRRPIIGSLTLQDSAPSVSVCKLCLVCFRVASSSGRLYVYFGAHHSSPLPVSVVWRRHLILRSILNYSYSSLLQCSCHRCCCCCCCWR